MSLAGSQQKIFLRLVTVLRPHWHTDPSLPLRIQQEFAANRSFGSRDRKLYRELRCLLRGLNHPLRGIFVSHQELSNQIFLFEECVF